MNYKKAYDILMSSRKNLEGNFFWNKEKSCPQLREKGFQEQLQLERVGN